MKTALICLFLVQMLDGVGTHYVINRFQSVDVEQNPVIRYLIRDYGMYGMYAFKLVMFAFLAFILKVFVYPYKSCDAKCVAWFGVGFYLCVCIFHVMTIYKLQDIDINDVQNYLRLWKS